MAILLYFIILYFMFTITLGRIQMDLTIDMDDKINLIRGAYFLYYGSLVAIYCQFTGLAALR